MAGSRCTEANNGCATVFMWQINLYLSDVDLKVYIVIKNHFFLLVHRVAAVVRDIADFLLLLLQTVSRLANFYS